jgi:CBS domain-containing protein
VTTCTIEDSLHHVLELMRRARVRRLPVVDREGGLVGIVTLSDVAVRSDKRSRGEIVETIQALRSQQRAAA